MSSSKPYDFVSSIGREGVLRSTSTYKLCCPELAVWSNLKQLSPLSEVSWLYSYQPARQHRQAGPVRL
jgi:hypothetical protein